MVLQKVNTKLVSARRKIQEKVSTMPIPKVAVAMVVGAVAIPLATSATITMTGFTAAGITAGSTAAGFMSTYGGNVAAGSACAVFQSIGAAGLGLKGMAILSTAGAFIGYAIYTIYKAFTKSEPESLPFVKETA